MNWALSLVHKGECVKDYSPKTHKENRWKIAIFKGFYADSLKISWYLHILSCLNDVFFSKLFFVKPLYTEKIVKDYMLKNRQQVITAVFPRSQLNDDPEFAPKPIY